jgi:hypothetical protein
MSNHYLPVEDQMLEAMNRIYAIKDPVERLKVIHKIQKFLSSQLRTAKRDAAYSARKTMTSSQLESLTDIYRKDIDYLVRCHIEDNPALPVLKHMRTKITKSIDLRGVSGHNRTIWEQMDELPESIDGDELRIMPLINEPSVDDRF